MKFHLKGRFRKRDARSTLIGHILWHDSLFSRSLAFTDTMPQPMLYVALTFLASPCSFNSDDECPSAPNLRPLPRSIKQVDRSINIHVPRNPFTRHVQASYSAAELSEASAILLESFDSSAEARVRASRVYNSRLFEMWRTTFFGVGFELTLCHKPQALDYE